MQNMKIIILGARGMLGQMVYDYFSTKGYVVSTYDERFTEANFDAYVTQLNQRPNSVIINCIGKIKQKSESSNELFLSNTLFPLQLCRSLKNTHILIHPSTDCVFDGKASLPYLSFDKHTASDVYGISKSLGETAVMARPNTLVVRVSIIGPDNNSDKGLLSWFLNNEVGAEINGYTNHQWNGITTLEWCKKLHDLLRDQGMFDELLKRGLVQLGTSKTYSKFEMLNIFQTTFSTKYRIKPFEAKEAVYRCLNPDLISVSLEDQMIELQKHIDKQI